MIYKYILPIPTSVVIMSVIKITNINEKGKQLPLFIIMKLFIILYSERLFPCLPMKGAITMSAIDNLIMKINEMLRTLNENQLIYVYTFLRKKFNR